MSEQRWTAVRQQTVGPVTVLTWKVGKHDYYQITVKGKVLDRGVLTVPRPEADDGPA